MLETVIFTIFIFTFNRNLDNRHALGSEDVMVYKNVNMPHAPLTAYFDGDASL